VWGALSLISKNDAPAKRLCIIVTQFGDFCDEMREIIALHHAIIGLYQAIIIFWFILRPKIKTFFINIAI